MHLRHTYVHNVTVHSIGWNKGVAFAPASPRHREYRKLLSTSLNTSAARRLSPLQQSSALDLLKALLNNPHELREHIRTSIGNNTVNIVFGEEISTPDFDYIALADDAHYKFALAATPYRYAVDFFPIRECYTNVRRVSSLNHPYLSVKYLPSWFPGATFKRQAREWQAELENLVFTPYKTVKERVVSSALSVCLA